MDKIFLFILAVIPGIAIAMFFYSKHNRELETPRYLMYSFLMGIVSFFISLGLGLLLHKYTNIDEGSVMHQMIRAVIFVGLVEEASKFLFLRGVIFHKAPFINAFDGIVYAVVLAMGFATAENIIYVLNGGGGTAIVRMFTAVPAHAVFAVLMGFFLGEAKVFKSSTSLYTWLALLVPTLVHGYYDYFLFLNWIPGIWWQAIVSLVIVFAISHFVYRYRKYEIVD